MQLSLVNIRMDGCNKIYRQNLGFDSILSAYDFNATFHSSNDLYGDSWTRHD
jgi:hypothetical protein